MRFLKNWEGTVEGAMPTYRPERAEDRLAVHDLTATSATTSRWASATTSPTSRDLTDLSYDHQGVFFNLVGSM